MFVDMKRHTLERFKARFNMHVSKELLQSVEPPQLDVMFDETINAMIAQVTAFIYGQQLGKVEISYPADWWQAAKQRFLPAWALARWPVRMTTKIVDVKALYPTLHIPQHPGILQVMVETETDWTHAGD